MSFFGDSIPCRKVLFKLQPECEDSAGVSYLGAPIVWDPQMAVVLISLSTVRHHLAFIWLSKKVVF